MKNQKNRWLFETLDVPYDNIDLQHGLKIKKRLYSGRSPYQKIEVFGTSSLGRLLVLDGIFQTSEKDEFVYHEMLCQLPMFYHNNPKKVLIIGGGDGGSLEEVLKHPVEKVWMVEIDKKVIDVSKKYLSSISKGAFDSKKAEIIIGDGFEFIKKYNNFFDVIILDLSDPWGPAKKLISVDFYKSIKKALRKGGVVSIQGGCFFYQIKLVEVIFRRLKKVFDTVILHEAPVVLYGVGDLNFALASDADLKRINLADIENKFKKLRLDLEYYWPKVHFASAVLPKYIMKKIKIK